MRKLNFPDYKHQLSKKDDVVFIYDTIRNKKLVLTPEEWVRQNLIQFLIEEKKYPKGLISMEAGLKLNTLQKRYDALVYSKAGKALVLIECKAPDVNVNQKVFEQILAYNRTIDAPYLLVSNGLNHYFLRESKDKQYKFIKELPDYSEL